MSEKSKELQVLEMKIKKLRTQINNMIKERAGGISDQKVIEASRSLDKLVNRHIKKKYNL